MCLHRLEIFLLNVACWVLVDLKTSSNPGHHLNLIGADILHFGSVIHVYYKRLIEKEVDCET